jgi:hypothetical protein
MKRVILHIGTEKTATTSLQEFFRLNQEQLSTQGIWYPSDESLDYCHRGGHFPLAASLMEERPEFISKEKYFEAEQLFKQLISDFDLRDEDTLLLSAEHFSSRCSRFDITLTLSQLLAGLDVKILVYLRPQQEMLISAYSTLIRRGGKQSLAEARQRWLRPHSLYFNHLIMLESWLENFSRESVAVRIFQEQVLVEGDIHADVMDYLGIELPSPKYPERLNTPISKELVDFLYLANQHFPQWGDEDRKGWELGQKFRREVIPFFHDGTPIEQLLSPEVEADTEAFYEDYNRKLCDIVRPDLDGQLFVRGKSGDGAEHYEFHKNCFTEAFVAWVIQLWTTGQHLHRHILDKVGGTAGADIPPISSA